LPPKPKNTRDEIISAALHIVQRSGIDALTARSLGAELSSSPGSIFTHFESMDEVTEGVLLAAKALYGSYVKRGLSMPLPFKGYAMEFIRFAKEERNLFSLLFMSRRGSSSLKEVPADEEYRKEIIHAVCTTFSLSKDKAETLYRKLWTYAYGIAALAANGICDFTDEEISGMLGSACRGFLLEINAPGDIRENTLPCCSVSMGEIDTYMEVPK